MGLTWEITRDAWVLTLGGDAGWERVRTGANSAAATAPIALVKAAFAPAWSLTRP